MYLFVKLFVFDVRFFILLANRDFRSIPIDSKTDLPRYQSPVAGDSYETSYRDRMAVRKYQ